jgi:hypothetical protein
MKEKNKKNWRIIFIVSAFLVLMALYFLFIFDIGLNSKYFVKRDFNTAFLARKTGNCNLFKEYVYTDKEKWGEQCIQEKDQEKPPIKEFFIKEITIDGNRAFLQVNLKREILPKFAFELSKEQIEIIEKGYMVNYDLIRDNSDRFIFFYKTRWLIKNEKR